MCKHLNKRYTMYVKNFNFFKSMCLRKNSRIAKKRNSFAAASPEKQAPNPYRSDSLQNFNNCLTPTY